LRHSVLILVKSPGGKTEHVAAARRQGANGESRADFKVPFLRDG